MSPPPRSIGDASHMPLTPWFGSGQHSSSDKWMAPARVVGHLGAARRKRSERDYPVDLPREENGIIPLRTLSGAEVGGGSMGEPVYPREEGEPPPPLALVPSRDEPGESEGGVPYWSRRCLNVTVALVGIALTLPLMVVIAILVKITSPGPILFTQPRVGLDRRWRTRHAGPDPRRKKDLGGRVFQIYKFRTMTHAPERSREQKWAAPDDPRVTPVGRFLRVSRMDELPQFFNVLKGDMNIVGPRPEQPEIFQQLREEVDGYQDRQRVLPGITGLAQVSHHYDQSIGDVEIKVGHDLDYIHKVSTLEDLRIMARTLPVILFRKGGW